MATKKVSYKNLLKQAISEFDTSKTVEVKGPMLDPILSWDGDGEVPIYKDAASILERYYFNEDETDQVNVDDLTETEYNEDGTEKKTDAEKHANGTGTTQAGTSDASDIRAMEKDQEREIAKEAEEILNKDDDDDDDNDADDADEEDMKEALDYFFEQDDADVDDGADDGADDADEPKDLDVDKEVDVTEDIENSVIEKLIDEMEDIDEADVMTYTDDGIKDGMEAPDEKKAKRPDEDAQGTGTSQAGTGTSNGQIPDRKDLSDEIVKSKHYNENAGEGPGPLPSAQDSASGSEDDEDDEDLAEAFEIFKEAIEEDSIEDIKI